MNVIVTIIRQQNGNDSKKKAQKKRINLIHGWCQVIANYSNLPHRAVAFLPFLQNIHSASMYDYAYKYVGMFGLVVRMGTSKCLKM